MARTVPSRVYSLEGELTHFSVKEAARLLGVSVRSVYGYLERGYLSRVYIEGMTMLLVEEVYNFDCQAPGRPREAPPLWHLPPELNPLFLTTMIVRMLPGCGDALERKLTEFRVQGKHQIAGTTARSISRTRDDPSKVLILLCWREATMPPQEQREQALAEFAADLSEVLDWTTAVVKEGDVLLHGG